MDDESGGEDEELEAEEAEVLDELDLVLAVADEALVEEGRALLAHHQVGLVPAGVSSGVARVEPGGTGKVGPAPQRREALDALR